MLAKKLFFCSIFFCVIIVLIMLNNADAEHSFSTSSDICGCNNITEMDSDDIKISAVDQGFEVALSNHLMASKLKVWFDDEYQGVIPRAGLFLGNWQNFHVDNPIRKVLVEGQGFDSGRRWCRCLSADEWPTEKRNELIDIVLEQIISLGQGVIESKVLKKIGYHLATRSRFKPTILLGRGSHIIGVFIQKSTIFLHLISLSTMAGGGRECEKGNMVVTVWDKLSNEPVPDANVGFWNIWANRELAEAVTDPHGEAVVNYESLVPVIDYVIDRVTIDYQGRHWEFEIEEPRCNQHVIAYVSISNGPYPIPSESITTALVLDGSGSMKGQKLEKAKQAANAYIADMKAGDCGTVVAFSTQAETLRKIRCIGAGNDEKQDLKNGIGNISATNSTNIAAGLSKGMDQLNNKPPGQKAAALLLSDGKHNVGPFSNVLNEAGKYRKNHWKIFTVAFGKDANLLNLCKIARITDGACAPAGIKNLIPVFQRMSSYAKNKSILLSFSEHLPPGTRLTYEIPVDSSAKVVTYYLSWEGSKLEAKLIQPDGKILRPEDLHGDLGRYEEGKTYHMMEVNDPQEGKWGLQIRWKIPPPVGEQVNILVSEKSDIFATILPFYNEYKLGQPVNIKVQIAELVGNKRVSLKNAAVRVEVKKPGPEMIRMVQAQSQKFTMYKDVMLDITRDLTLFDDGIHNDFRAGDRIFGNTFRETDENGAYLVTAVITGKKQNGQKVEKRLQGSFQVGPISQNIVTTSQILHYTDKAKSHIDDKTPYKEDILRKPMEEIEELQGGGDPLDSINKLLRGQ